MTLEVVLCCLSELGKEANRKGGCMRTARLICTETCAASLEHVGEPGCGGLAESQRLRGTVVV